MCRAEKKSTRDHVIAESNENESQSPWLLVGLVSWGYQCGRYEKPGVYTDIAAYQNWIRAVLTLRPQLEQDFWNSLLECKGSVVSLGQCEDRNRWHDMFKQGIFCYNRRV